MPVTIIAEAGINHQNDIRMADALIDAAVIAGANVVKFQASTVVEEISVRAAPDHFADIGKLVPTWGFLHDCKALCDQRGVEFLCTPSGLDSLQFVLSLGVKRIKVASDNLTNVPFLRAVAKANLPVILSTGMGTMDEIMRAVGLLASHQHRLTLLHCVSLYPCPVDRINISAMDLLRRYGIVGLSDHTQSIMVPALAVARGAMVIEKHITMDRSLPGPDHAASLDPYQFTDMVALVREAEVALGWGQKAPVGGEEEAAKLYRKSLVAARPIKMGEQFTPDNVAVKRPGTGRPAASWDSVMGTAARRDYEQDELL